MFYRTQSKTASGEAMIDSKVKGGMKMKTTKEIKMEQACRTLRLGVLTLVMLTLLCIPQMITVADAQKHVNQAGWYSGMSYLAEQEIRTEQQNAIAEKEKNETHITTNTNVDVDDNEEDHSSKCSLVLTKEGTKC